MPRISRRAFPAWARTLNDKRRSVVRRYVEAELSYVALFLVAPVERTPCKLGISTDVSARLADWQAGNWIELRVVQAWWLAGKPLAIRLESAATEFFRSKIGRADWINVAPNDVVDFVSRTAADAKIPTLIPAAYAALLDRSVSKVLDTKPGTAPKMR